MLGTRPLNTGTCVDQPITGCHTRMYYAWTIGRGTNCTVYMRTGDNNKAEREGAAICYCAFQKSGIRVSTNPHNVLQWRPAVTRYSIRCSFAEVDCVDRDASLSYDVVMSSCRKTDTTFAAASLEYDSTPLWNRRSQMMGTLRNNAVHLSVCLLVRSTP